MKKMKKKQDVSVQLNIINLGSSLLAAWWWS
jgi:hypothetical protein